MKALGAGFELYLLFCSLLVIHWCWKMFLLFFRALSLFILVSLGFRYWELEWDEKRKQRNIVNSCWNFKGNDKHSFKTLFIYLWVWVCMCRSQRTSFRSWFFSATWLWGITLRLSGLVTSTFNGWAILLVQDKHSYSNWVWGKGQKYKLFSGHNRKCWSWFIPKHKEYFLCGLSGSQFRGLSKMPFWG